MYGFLNQRKTTKVFTQPQKLQKIKTQRTIRKHIEVKDDKSFLIT